MNGLVLIIVVLNILYIWGVFKVNDMMNYNLYGKFTLELTPNKFSLTVNKIKTDYKYKQIKKHAAARNKKIENKNDFFDFFIIK